MHHKDNTDRPRGAKNRKSCGTLEDSRLRESSELAGGGGGGVKRGHRAARPAGPGVLWGSRGDTAGAALVPPAWGAPGWRGWAHCGALWCFPHWSSKDPRASTPSHDTTTSRVEPRAGCGCSLPALASPCFLPPPVEHCERRCSPSQRRQGASLQSGLMVRAGRPSSLPAPRRT